MSRELRANAAAAARRATAEALAFLLLVLINPFEIVQWSEQRSRDIWQRIHAPRYVVLDKKRQPPPPLPGTAYGRKQITVVYSDDRTLEALGQTRPLSAFALIDMMDDVLYVGGEGAAPRAIFVDFLLTHAAPPNTKGADLVSAIPSQSAACAERRKQDPPLSPFQCLIVRTAEITRYKDWADDPFCRESNLATIRCILKEGGTPLIFADPRPPVRTGPPLESPALDALSTVAAIAPVAVAEVGYPMVDPQRAADREQKPFQLYPAAALYAAYCYAAPSPCDPTPVRLDDQARAAWSWRYENPIDVTWGIGPESEFTKMMDKRLAGSLKQRCQPAANQSAVGTLFRLLTAGINTEAKPPCVYTDAIPYEIFQSSISQEDLASVLRDRLVLIGGQFADSNDIVDAPPFGALPGIYYHAMALDNLIQRGASYPEIAQPIVTGLDMTWVDMSTLLAIFLVGFILALATRILLVRRSGQAMSLSQTGADLGKRFVIALIFALFLILILITMIGSVRLIPESFNLVAVTLVCLLGLLRLAWVAVDPVRVWLLRHSAFVRFWSRLFAPLDDEPKRAAAGKKKAAPKGRRRREGAE
jgi:CHASE2 domain-containing sensor protein